MSSISQHISPDLIRLERTSIIYDVTDIVFSLKQHIPPPGRLLMTEVSLVLHRSHGQSKYAVYHSDSAQDVSLVRFHGVLALLSDSFPFTVR